MSQEAYAGNGNLLCQVTRTSTERPSALAAVSI